MDKANIRQSIKRKLGLIGQADLAAGEEKVRDLLVRFIETIHPAPSILAYHAHFPGEINVLPVMSVLRNPSMLFLPRLSGLEMRFVAQAKFPPLLEQGTRGVAEPVVTEDCTEFEAVSGGPNAVVLVPGLAFTASGVRLGRGGGYYDRFLSLPGMSGGTCVGICWEFQIVSDLPYDRHDVPVQWICTPERLFPTQ